MKTISPLEIKILINDLKSLNKVIPLLWDPCSLIILLNLKFYDDYKVAVGLT